MRMTLILAMELGFFLLHSTSLVVRNLLSKFLQRLTLDTTEMDNFTPIVKGTVSKITINPEQLT